ncbi:MAG: VCBS repeat-containing protein [Calditrichaceae bacterium]|nr:VCBS repeat-containing protein [Calditrichaceae bacterium]RQV97111.1 MAG: T9SS C-terminal target domain-containing protein [Calditrichota bacterium]
MKNCYHFIFLFFCFVFLVFAREPQKNKPAGIIPDEFDRIESTEKIMQTEEIPTKLISIELISTSKGKLATPRFIYKGGVDEASIPYIDDPTGFEALVNGNDSSSISPNDSGQYYISNGFDSTIFNMLRRQNKNIFTPMYEMTFGNDNAGFAYKSLSDGDYVTQIPFRVWDLKGTPDNFDDDEEMLVWIYPVSGDTISWGIAGDEISPWSLNPAYESEWIYILNFKEGINLQSDMNYDSLAAEWIRQQNTGQPSNRLSHFYGSEIMSRITLNSLMSNPITSINQMNGYASPNKGVRIRWSFNMGLRFKGPFLFNTFVGDVFGGNVEVIHDWHDNITYSLDLEPSGMEIDQMGNLYWEPTSAQFGQHEFIIEVQGRPGIIDKTFSIWVDRVSRDGINHVTNKVLFTRNNTSAIGQDGWFPESSGFIYNGEQGLYTGSLVISNGKDHVVGANLYETSTNSAYTPLTPIEYISQIFNGFNQNFISEYSDERSPTPMGLRIVQRSYSNASDPDHNGYVVLDYDIINETENTLDSIYIGLFSDWDVGGPVPGGYDMNRTKYDTTLQLLYSYNDDGLTEKHFGTMLLVGETSGASDEAHPNSILEIIEDMKNNMIWSAKPTDVQNMLSTGPYTIEAGKSIRVAYAILGGNDLTELFLNATNARTLPLVDNNITFQVDMNYAKEQGLFDPENGDRVAVRGPFNDWGGTGQLMQDPDTDGIYTITLELSYEAGTVVEYKYAILNAGVYKHWETKPDPDFPPDFNRHFEYLGRNLTLPVDVYDNNDGSNPFIEVNIEGITTEQMPSHGICWADFNNDGFEDIIITNEGNNSYFLQNTTGGFDKITASVVGNDGKTSRAAVSADFNNDGFPDLFVSNGQDQSNLLYRGTGNGVFEQISAGLIVEEENLYNSQNAAWVDANSDGWLDLYVCNNDLHPNFFYLNNGDGTFNKDTQQPLSLFTQSSYSCVWADFDNDGDPDCYVTNGNDENNNYFRNNGDGSYSSKASGSDVTSIGDSRGCDAGDFDNDGDFDLLVTNYTGTHWLFENDGKANFTLSSAIDFCDARNTRGCGFLDFNNDGWLDIFIANEEDNQLFVNENGTFREVVYGPFIWENRLTITAAWCDYNNDGKPDLFCANAPDSNSLYLNTTQNNWLQVKVLNNMFNTDAIGARVTIKAQIDAETVYQTREIRAGSGYNVQNSLIAAFGLKETTTVDSIWIKWPMGTVWDTANVNVNQRLFIKEPYTPFPVLMTSEATSITESAATLNGKVNPKGLMTTVRFLYGKDSGIYTDSVQAVISPFDADTLTSVYQDVQGLQSDQTYYFRVAVINSMGRFLGNVLSFATLSASGLAQVTTLPAEKISVHTAILPGTANPNGLETTVIFQYGFNQSNLEYSIAPPNNNISGTSAVELNAYVQGLNENSAYYYRIKADNSAGESLGEILSLGTLGYPTQIEIGHTYNFPDRANPGDFVSEDYRMIGLPGNGNLDIKTVIDGTAGQNFQLYWDNGAASDYLVKYDDQSSMKFEKGKAYWLVMDGNLNINISDIDNSPLNNDDQTAIGIHNGWNLITNPYPEPVSWSDVLQVNGLSAIPLWDYDRGYISTDLLMPYKGYYFFNSSDAILLLVPYWPVSSGTIASPWDMDWEVNIDVCDVDQAVTSLKFGVKPNSKEKLDLYDYRIPRPLSNATGAYFNRAEWDEDYPLFGADIRPEYGEYQEWNFTVTGKASKVLTVRFSDLEKIDEALDIYLADMSSLKFQDLRINADYDLRLIDSKNDLRLMIGAKEKLEEALRNIVPAKFTVGQNFPNPFNPETTIPIATPADDFITISIFNVLGQKVVDLYNGSVSPGRHFYTWDGRDIAGKRIPSGIYFYQIRSKSGQNVVGKMILMK